MPRRRRAGQRNRPPSLVPLYFAVAVAFAGMLALWVMTTPPPTAGCP